MTKSPNCLRIYALEQRNLLADDLDRVGLLVGLGLGAVLLGNGSVSLSKSQHDAHCLYAHEMLPHLSLQLVGLVTLEVGEVSSQGGLSQLLSKGGLGELLSGTGLLKGSLDELAVGSSGKVGDDDVCWGNVVGLDDLAGNAGSLDEKLKEKMRLGK